MWLLLIECSLYDFYNIKIKNVYCTLLVAIKTVYKMHGTYIKICNVHCITSIGGFVPFSFCFVFF